MKRTFDQSMKHEEEPMQLLVRMKSVITARGRCLNFKSATYKVKQKNKINFHTRGGGQLGFSVIPSPRVSAIRVFVIYKKEKCLIKAFSKLFTFMVCIKWQAKSFQSDHTEIQKSL